MEQYINKSALVAEIRKRLLPVIRDKHYDEWEEGQNSERIAILSFIDTLDVKEVTNEKTDWFPNKKQMESLKDMFPQAHWKPSDEQMEALYKASKNEYLKADQYDVLLELWNNLKKLKEE